MAQWNKIPIDLSQIESINENFLLMIRAANPIVENIRLVLKLKDDPIIYVYPLLDWVDQKIDVNQIDKLIGYQLFNEN